MGNKFTEEEANRLALLMRTITAQAEFKTNMDGFVKIYNELEWVSKTLIPKIKDNVFEITKVTKAKGK